MRVMHTETKPLYLVIDPQNQRPSVEREIRFFPASIQTYSRLGSAKTYKEKVRSRIRLNSSWCFDVTSAGHPIAWQSGAQLRRATPEDAATYDSITEQINALYKQRGDLCRAAHERGEMVHKSEAANLKPETQEVA